MADKTYEEIEHTADWALRIKGEDLAELLQNAALGMFQLAGAEPASTQATVRTFEVKGVDSESLLVAWLEELLFALETQNVMVTEMQLRLQSPHHLSAEVKEKPCASLGKHIKAVTFHNLTIEQSEDGYHTTVVFDV
jgi:SHS2 domain-containing protein